MIIVNGMKVLVLKDALDRICEDLYEELPMGYAERAIKIIKRNINKTIRKIKYKHKSTPVR